MSPNVKLLYFPLRGRAELIRLVLSAGGVKYDEELITFDEWPNRKAEAPLGQLPMLVWDGESLAQSLTIARFVARKTGLAGDDDVEVARADIIAEHVNDAISKYYDARFCKDAARKAELSKELCETLLPRFFDTAEALLQKRGGKHFTAKKLSYGDLAMFMAVDVFSNAKEMSEGGFGDFHSALVAKIRSHKLIQDLVKTVQANAKVSAYLKARPDFPF